jgi:hypothetical protein
MIVISSPFGHTLPPFWIREGKIKNKRKETVHIVSRTSQRFKFGICTQAAAFSLHPASLHADMAMNPGQWVVCLALSIVAYRQEETTSDSRKSSVFSIIDRAGLGDAYVKTDLHPEQKGEREREREIPFPFQPIGYAGLCAILF